MAKKVEIISSRGGRVRHIRLGDEIITFKGEPSHIAEMLREKCIDWYKLTETLGDKCKKTTRRRKRGV